MVAHPTNAEPDLVIAGKIRTSTGQWARGEVWIAGESIIAVHERERAGQPPPAARLIDVGDDFVLPGAVDAHVHSLSHPGEGIAAATRAAAAGGVTTIVEMPFDAAGPVNTLDRLCRKQDLVNDEACVDVAILGTLAPGGGWREAENLAKGGVVGLKVSLFLTHPDRFPRINDFELLDVMSAAADVERTLCVHAENNEIVQGSLAVQARADPTDPRAHERTRPPISETLGVLTAVEIAADREAPLHLCHMSLSRGIDLVGWYQSQGVDVTLETCPHYLTFTGPDMDRSRGRLKINPPLRGPEDRAGLWQRVESGAVRIISSDHAPWPASHKDHARILDNHSGVPGVETLVPVTLGQALARDPQPAQLGAFSRAVDALTLAPARRFGLDGRKGSLEVGKDADVVVFSPSSEARIDGTRLHSNAGWSPYDGMAPGGQVRLTVARGRQVWSADSGFTGQAGYGEVMERRGIRA